MIQGGAMVVEQQQQQHKKISTPSLLSPSPTTTTTSTEPQQNLRCPRCDSTNTKFCYYNNYNLTQPRHFCKTCRRYWTKGGALRNVPIGGGCRKAKPSPAALSSASKSAHAKLRTSLAGFDQDLRPSPMTLWPAPSQASTLMSLLRSAHSSTPGSFPLLTANPNPREETGLLASYPSPLPPLSHQIPTEPFAWKTNSTCQYLHQQLTLPQLPSPSALQELLYQKLRTNCQTPDHTSESMMATLTTPAFPSNAPTGGGGSVLDQPIPIGGSGDQLSYWNTLPLAWSDMPAANGGCFP